LKRVYLDANVFIAWAKEDIGMPFKLMYQDAELFFRQCPEKYVLVLSGHAFEEIEKIIHYTPTAMLDFFI